MKNNKTYKDLINEVKEGIDIVDVAKDQIIGLKKKGSNYQSCCPFHNEKTPSFSVSPAKQIFSCFGCGEKGDVISLVQKTKGISFHDTLIELAAKLNIDTSKYLDEKKVDINDEEYKLKQSILIANDAAKELFVGQLGDEHIEYLTNRGFTKETIKKFEIGYCSKNQDIANQLKGFDPKVLIKASLLRKRENGTTGSFFWDSRLMFPIANRSGKTVSFGARTLSDDVKPKYINTSNTAVYEKSNTLYGLHLAINSIIKERFVSLVEGYTDVMMMHQNHYENTVAKCGTAFTSAHAKELKRYTDKMLLIPDGDILAMDVIEAEISEEKDNKKIEVLNKRLAAAKMKFKTFENDVNVCLDNGLKVELVQLPYEKDPCGMKEEIKEFMLKKKDAVIYLSDKYFQVAVTIQERTEAINKVAKLIAKTNDSARIIYIDEVAKVNNLKINHLKKVIKENIPETEKAEENKQSLDSLLRIKVKDTFYQLYTDIDSEMGTVNEYYQKRSRKELENEIGRYNVSQIPRFDNAVVEPFHENFKYIIYNTHTSYRTGDKPVIYKSINWYNPLPIQSKEFNIKDTSKVKTLLYFHEHIFGKEYLELGLDYMTIMYKYPKRKLPALCLVSRKRKTGKSTLIDLYSLFYGSNSTKSSIYRLQQNFNALLMGKILVSVEETKDANGTAEEKLKDFVTGRDLIVEGKGRDAIQVKNYAKFIFASNHPESFLKITDNEDRFMVFEVPTIPKERYDNKLLHKMRKELAYWRHFLENREIVHADKSRLWFDPATYQTEALAKVKSYSQSPTIAALHELIREIFMNAMPKKRSTNTPLTSMRLSSKILAEYMNKYLDKRGKYTPRGMTAILNQHNLYSNPHATKFLYPNVAIVNTSSVWSCEIADGRGKYYTFHLEDYLNTDEIKDLYKQEEIKEMFPTHYQDYALATEKDNDIPF